MKKLKTFYTAFFLVVFTISTVNSQNNFHNHHILDPYNPEYVKGEVLVKFKDEVVVKAEAKAKAKDEVKVTTGVKSIDNFLKDYKAIEIEKVFKETRESLQKKTGGQPRYMTDFKGNRYEVPKLYNIYKLKFDEARDAKQLSELLSQDPAVDYAEPNYLVYTMDTYTNDPLYLDGSQWYLDTVNAPAAWDSVTGDTTQIFGIIDTGVDWDHPDLDDNIWTNWNEIPDNGIDDDGNGFIDDTRGWDFVNDDNNPNDDNSHGTHVAGIAAAEGNNGIGMCGVAWNSRIMPVKMLQSSGVGSSSDLASAIEYASNNGATVINMSLGSYGESMTVKIALQNAYAGTGSGGGSMLVAAAGNGHKRVGPNPCRTYPYAPFYPACYQFVIGVMASDAGPCYGFSNWDFSGPVGWSNDNYEIQAPGIGIISCKPNGNYWQKSGTSMSSPIVAGGIALMRQYQPSQSGEQTFAKLIQGANSGVLDIYNSLIIDLIPDLYYIDYTIVDTLPGCDGDGVADAGETIELYLTVKNAGGFADSVWSKFRFGEFEDTTVANIIDSTSYIGDISAYATLTGELDPFKIKIDSNLAHNRDIVFKYEIGAKNTNSFSANMIITIQNAVELGGFFMEDMTLEPNKLYLVVESILIDDSAKLTIQPGAELRFSPQKSIKVLGILDARGNSDSLITIRCDNSNNWGGQIRLESSQQDTCYLQYVNFYRMSPVMFYYTQSGPVVFTDNIIEESYMYDYMFFSQPSNYLKIESNLFLNNYYNYAYFSISGNQTFKHNIIMSNGISITGSGFYTRGTWDQGAFSYNTFIDNRYTAISTDEGNEYQDHSENYWGTVDSLTISENITDYFDNPYFRVSVFWPFLNTPSPIAHGHVWKVEINDVLINKYDNPYSSPTGLGVVGAEPLKFNIYFNRPMDTAYAPLLTFGVREPYTQHIVADSASWSSDSTVWTAYHTVGLETGDGVQTVRVANAKDDEHFEIPIEDSRFEFVIQAASAASIQFIATPGIGKVDLEWPPANTPDVLGYNLYRFYNLTDSTYSDTTMINTELILDTLYTDFNVIPDTTYHYLYTILGTDMAESDYSKKVTATPFDAANGDANGDLAVNVLDITTIVSYMLNQNPTPFLFDAADVNYDGDINVLDIIGLVQLISGGKSVPLTAFIDISEKTAYYDIADDILSLESEGNVAALQLNLGLKGKDFLPHLGEMSEGQRGQVQSLEKLKIFSLQSGFEFAYAVVDDHIIGIIFSLIGKEIPEGHEELFRFEGIDLSEIEVSKIFGGDLNGDYVPVLKKGQQSGIKLPEGYELRVQPNPFTSSTVISWQLVEDAMVDISIYDLKGENIKQIKNSYQSAGVYQQNWNVTDTNGKKLPAGIYICHMEAIPVDGSKKVTKDIKLVLIK